MGVAACAGLPRQAAPSTMAAAVINPNFVMVVPVSMLLTRVCIRVDHVTDAFFAPSRWKIASINVKKGNIVYMSAR
jgi:formaldehyde-activating enzyme involved in methanogenesis